MVGGPTTSATTRPVASGCTTRPSATPDLDHEVMQLSAESGLLLAVFSAEPGSRSANALDLLASWTATPEQGQAAGDARERVAPREPRMPLSTPREASNPLTPEPCIGPAGLPKPEEGTMSQLLLDAAGRRRSPATLPGFHAGRPPRNKGRRYPADPPTAEKVGNHLSRRRRDTGAGCAD